MIDFDRQAATVVLLEKEWKIVENGKTSRIMIDLGKQITISKNTILVFGVCLRRFWDYHLEPQQIRSKWGHAEKKRDGGRHFISNEKF